MAEELAISRRELEERLDEEPMGYSLMMGSIMGMVVLMMMAALIQSEATALARVPISIVALPPTAANAGAIWLQTTPPGQPNELRMITENSTGAFEAVLLGLST